MKEKAIRFFTPDENTNTKLPKAATKSAKLTGYISGAGKLVFPAKTLDQLELEADTVQFRIGTQTGKRSLKSLYLVPTNDEQADTFSLQKAAKSYTLALGVILEKGGVDYRHTKYTFTIEPFDYEAGVVGYELRLAGASPAEKPAYTGKPRGRKPKHA
ncbi:hypothetical protein [Spirosoma utsteinense]|uniref:CYTH domain-containing protein n=1 Tax=Spirosoma utsteinense TaxID=2585773 RepID=A0ABR6WE78_9BACT|nr:hypothetical protein [Spirosoma utsteinense]MBC3788920.1 CYTH domain-containing protein [Spirosoma utsteinense]MBC3794837.1 CYTH domain-containing protein [Spirosoma utsteinense]